uniref:Uncharacterized protein n=1 Tax=Anguilla anguilla TaxID=7936 RepID=A0A0E9TD76_ANGAN
MTEELSPMTNKKLLQHLFDRSETLFRRLEVSAEDLMIRTTEATLQDTLVS